MKEIGIYVHIPFCVSKCAYCDFYSLPEKCHGEELKRRYVSALTRQFEFAEKKYGHLAVSTVFVGGGTPTVLSAELLTELITALKSHFDLTRNTEFTVEANPKTFDLEKLTALRGCRVNRLSIGVQSANETELRTIGRIHSFQDAKNAFNLTRKSGFDNISVDLIYGLPYQTEASFLDSVNEIIKLSPEHISVYGLQLEEGTPLYAKRDALPFPSEDECVSMYSKAISLLAKNGYERYEISNFAKKGYESRHNVGYWSQKEYLGFGAGAYSFFDSKRFSTASDVTAFCECKDFDALTAVDEVLTDEDRTKEFIMLSLRLVRGFATKELFDRTRNAEFYLKRCEPFVKSGHLQSENGRIFFTEKGFNVSNAVLSEILF